MAVLTQVLQSVVQVAHGVKCVHFLYRFSVSHNKQAGDTLDLPSVRLIRHHIEISSEHGQAGERLHSDG